MSRFNHLIYNLHKTLSRLGIVEVNMDIAALLK
jgi:hypothetical protein